MEFYTVLKERHSVRTFKSAEVESGKIERIVESATLAPSAGNLQSYKIYIVKKESVKEEIARACYDQEFIAEAPVVFVFSGDRERAAGKYEERGYEIYAVQDATIAAAYAQLAATAEGLGSVWVGAFDPLEISRILNLPSYFVPVAVIPVGYPAEKPSPRKRRPLKEIVKEIK